MGLFALADSSNPVLKIQSNLKEMRCAHRIYANIFTKNCLYIDINFATKASRWKISFDPITIRAS